MFDHICIESSCFNAVSLRYGCCSDYMMVMLNDITGWLKQQDIPYFITYGTLLGTQRKSHWIRNLQPHFEQSWTAQRCCEREGYFTMDSGRLQASSWSHFQCQQMSVKAIWGGHGHCGGSFILAKTPARFGGEALTSMERCTIDQLLSFLVGISYPCSTAQHVAGSWIFWWATIPFWRGPMGGEGLARVVTASQSQDWQIDQYITSRNISSRFLLFLHVFACFCYHRHRIIIGRFSLDCLGEGIARLCWLGGVCNFYCWWEWCSAFWCTATHCELPSFCNRHGLQMSRCDKCAWGRKAIALVGQRTFT